MRDKEILDLKDKVVSKKEIDLMIREAVVKIKEETPRSISQSPQTAIRRKANKILNRVEIMQEMASLLQKGLSTTEMYNIIVNEKMLIKKTCFFKYIKIIRAQTPQTPRSKIEN